MDILFLGEAGLVISFKDGKVAIDPVARHMPLEKIVEECKGLKLVLLTHEHKEHFDSELVEALFNKYNPYVIGPSHVLLQLGIDSTYKSDVVVGDVFELSGFEVHVMRAAHPQSKYAVSYLLKNRAATLYYAGDTYEMEEMYKLQADIAIIPIRGMETLGAAQAARMVPKMKFERVMPVYWADRKDLVEFMMVAKEKALRPELGRWVKV